MGATHSLLPLEQAVNHLTTALDVLLVVGHVHSGVNTLPAPLMLLLPVAGLRLLGANHDRGNASGAGLGVERQANTNVRYSGAYGHRASKWKDEDTTETFNTENTSGFARVFS